MQRKDKGKKETNKILFEMEICRTGNIIMETKKSTGRLNRTLDYSCTKN
jgi:hypothetical protein